MRKKAVIALGGNALIKENQEGTIYEQFANTREVCKSIVKIIKEGWENQEILVNRSLYDFID